ncbi:MAG: TrmH family RNA methyltransferase, partial [Methanobacteriaceae archaeon]
MIFENLDEFLDNTQIDTIIGSTASPGGSYNLSRIAVKINELTENMNSRGKIAILFGREGNGLSNDEIDLCDIIVSIPTDPNYPVMNISHAAAIVFYEIFKTAYEFPKEGLELATSIEKDYLINDIDKIIKGINLPKHKEKTNLKAFKNIINRAFITGREAHTLKGLFRKINLKLNNSDDGSGGSIEGSSDDYSDENMDGK